MVDQRLINRIKEILPQRKKDSFGTIDIYPKDVAFATKNPGEVIFIKVRKHIMSNIGWITNSVFLLLGPVFILLVFDFFKIYLNENVNAKVIVDMADDFFSFVSSVPLTLWIIAFLIYYSFTISYIYMNFIDWYFHIYLVTNERIMHIAFKAFSGTHIAEAALKNVEDVSEKVIGFFPALFQYGDVRVQTEAHRSRFNFKSVPNPTWFRDTLMDLAKLVQTNEP